MWAGVFLEAIQKTFLGVWEEQPEYQSQLKLLPYFGLFVQVLIWPSISATVKGCQPPLHAPTTTPRLLTASDRSTVHTVLGCLIWAMSNAAVAWPNDTNDL